MCWGGLRGALGLALAIQVSLDRAGGEVTEYQAQRVLFYVAGIAFMTLVVNAPTCPSLVRYLQLNRPSGTKQMMMLNLKRKMRHLTDEHIGNSALGDELGHMLQEIDKTVNVCIDPRIEQAAAKMRIHHGGDHHGGEERDGKPSDDPLALADDEDPVSRLDQCRLSMGSMKKISGEMAKVASLKYKLEEARQLFRGIRPASLDLLGVLSAPHMIDAVRQKEAIQMLMQEGDTAKPMQMQPINDVFLSLVEAKLWARIQGGEFIGGEGEELLTCVAAARPMAPYYLTDLDHLRSVLLTLHDQDMDAISATALQTLGENPSLAVSEQSMTASMSAQYAVRRERSMPLASSERFSCFHRIGHSTAYTVATIVVALVATLSSMFIAISSEVGETYHYGAWSVVITVGFNLFAVDLAVKIGDQGWRFFDSNWNKLDLFLSIVAAIGLVLEVMVLASSSDDEIMGTTISQWIRAVDCFQVMRVHVLSRYVRASRGLRKMASTSHNATRLKAISMLVAFANAHIDSQEELIKYFGKNGSVGSGLVARTIVESLTEVYKAIVIAHWTSKLVDPSITQFLSELRSAILTTDDLCHLVEQAHSCGAMTEEDAESLLHPLKHHKKVFGKMKIKAHEGSIPYVEDLRVIGEDLRVTDDAVAARSLAAHTPDHAPDRTRFTQTDADVEAARSSQAPTGQRHSSAQTQPQGVFLECTQRKLTQLLSGLQDGLANSTTQTDPLSKDAQAGWPVLPVSWLDCSMEGAGSKGGAAEDASTIHSANGHCHPGGGALRPGDPDTWSVDSDDLPGPPRCPHGIGRPVL